MTARKKPKALPPWTRARVVAALAAGDGAPVKAAAAVGITSQRFYQLLAKFGIAAATPPSDPSAYAPHNGGSAPVTVSLRRETHAWLNARGKGMRSAAVQRGLDYLSAPDRAVWLAENEDPTVLARAFICRSRT